MGIGLAQYAALIYLQVKALAVMVVSLEMLKNAASTCCVLIILAIHYYYVRGESSPCCSLYSAVRIVTAFNYRSSSCMGVRLRMRILSC